MRWGWWSGSRGICAQRPGSTRVSSGWWDGLHTGSGSEPASELTAGGGGETQRGHVPHGEAFNMRAPLPPLTSLLFCSACALQANPGAFDVALLDTSPI